MADWVTISALATGAGTMVLAVATFAAVRSANRAARVAEQAFLPQLRDLYVGSGDIGFWQAAIRDPSDDDYGWLRDAIAARNIFLIELLYSDPEGARGPWVCSRSRRPGPPRALLVVRHGSLDRPNPR